MSWQEREYSEDPWRKAGRPGGDWKGLRPTFDNPMSWALPLMRVGGVTVRIHIIFLLFIIVQLARAIGKANVNDPAPFLATSMIIMLGWTLVMVLLHEFGHVIACRWAGGEANEILMWPLGGLAYCSPPNTWRAHLITVLGGPTVNALFLLVVTPMLYLLTYRWSIALPNPVTMSFVFEREYGDDTVVRVLCLLNLINIVLLLFNALPMFPMDGGRVLQTILWSKLGYSRSMRIAVRVGYLGAIGLGLYGFIAGDPQVIGIAIFGGITCYITYKQVEFTDQTMGFEDDEYALSLSYGQADADKAAPSKPAASARQIKAAAREAQREQEEAAEVDRILQKIADTGLNSLSRAEKKLLEQATERKRQQKQ